LCRLLGLLVTVSGLAKKRISEHKTVNQMNSFKANLDSLFAESKTLEKEIQKQLNGLKYE
jgi:hypothetical protein